MSGYFDDDDPIYEPPEEKEMDFNIPFYGISPNGHIVVNPEEVWELTREDPTWNAPDYWITHSGDD